MVARGSSYIVMMCIIIFQGRKKKAMTFNVEEMFEKSRRTAKEYSANMKG